MADQACCSAGPAIQSDYTPVGSTERLEGQEVYITGDATPAAIILVYDIFGFSPQAKQVCDRLAVAGFTVAMPDFFHGKPWAQDNYPPKDMNDLYSWMGQYDYDSVLTPEINKVVDHLKSKGATTFGIVGFCWGGFMTLKATSTDTFKAGAAVHPAMLSAENVENVKVPLCLLPSKDEPELAPIKEVLDKKPFGSECVYKKYDNMHHGFCAARGDWTVIEQAEAASDAIGILSNFFQKHVQ